MKRPIEIESAEFESHRAHFKRNLKPNSIAIFHSGDQFLKSADATHQFYQNPDLFYLTGIDQEDTILVLFPDAPNEAWKEVLFIKETSDHIKVWEGIKLSKEEANNQSGIKNCQWNSLFEGMFKTMMHYAEHIYINLNEHDRASFDGDYKDLRFLKKCQSEFPIHQYERTAPIISLQRMVKSTSELQVMKKACQITELAFRNTLATVKPGMNEYEVESDITYIFNKNRATHAYNPIIAGGANACILHYNDNDKALREGELLLMDFGSAYSNYASDMTRTIPVNGRFSSRQKAVYQACLNVFKECKNFMSSKIPLIEVNKESKKIMESELIKLGLLDELDVINQNPSQPLVNKYFPHGVSHFIGLDVHDVGNHYINLPNNCVLTCEPGIYIPEEGIGIRIENNIVVRDNGNVDLMASIPIEIEEIEDLMNSH